MDRAQDLIKSVSRRGALASAFGLLPLSRLRSAQVMEEIWTFDRLDRINEMIRAKLGSITVESIQRYLSDHASYPTSICRHPQTSDLGKGFEVAGRTVAAMIAEPAEQRMHVARGNPCESQFVTYSMDM